MQPIKFFKCLADETRLLSLLLIHQEGELCVCELMAALSTAQPKISRHLAQLRQCELLIDRREGQWVYYQINPKLAQWAKDVLDISYQQNKDYLVHVNAQLNKMNNRPQAKNRCC